MFLSELKRGCIQSVDWISGAVGVEYTRKKCLGGEFAFCKVTSICFVATVIDIALVQVHRPPCPLTMVLGHPE